jgi:hypothetical protein
MSPKSAIKLILLMTIMLLIKVYIANEIYYLSRDIQKISAKTDALKEEQSIVKLKVERLEYKNTISDPLLNYEDMKRKLIELKEETL